MANNITIDIDTPIIYRGADISKHNGDIDWGKVDNKELNFVIIRAGYGFSTVDVQFYRNIEGAIKAGVDVGIYWFSYAHTAEDAKLEAQACLRTIEPYKEHITFPVWFDWEYDSDNYVRNHYGIVLDKARVSAIAKSFMQTVEAAGYKTGNYSNPDYLKRYFNDDIKNNYDVWLAHVKDGKGNPRLRSDYQGAYTMHQYSWVGQPKGFNSKTDMNFCYYDYTGKAVNIPEEELKPAVEKPKIWYATPKTDNVIKVYRFKDHGKKFISTHFQVNEFASYKSNTELYSNEVKIHNKLVVILEELFQKLNCSIMYVNSGYRTPEHDKAVGGDGKGYHTKGRAADISCYDKDRKIIDARKVCIALEEMGGIYGIGYISPTSVHVDTRPEQKKWYGDETIKGAPNISKYNCKTFKEYFAKKLAGTLANK